MPFARRPDSWLIIPGSTGPRRRIPTSPTNADDPLSQFASEMSAQAISSEKLVQIIASEKPTQVILVPGAPVTSHIIKSDVTTPARHVQNSPIVPHTPTQRPTVAASEQRRLVASVAAYAQKTRALATDVKKFPRTALVAFAGGTAAGVLAMWFVSAPAASTAVPVATQTFAPRASPPPPAPPASSPDARATAEGVRQVGTSGRTTSARTARRARTASAVAAKPKAAAAAPASRYKGSLAFRSEPQGAKVFVNGTFVGSTPLVLENLPVGSRAVRFEADGYQRWSASTRVVADRQTGVSATLAPARP